MLKVHLQTLEISTNDVMPSNAFRNPHLCMQSGLKLWSSSTSNDTFDKPIHVIWDGEGGAQSGSLNSNRLLGSIRGIKSMAMVQQFKGYFKC